MSRVAMQLSSTQLVIIPSYNTGAKLCETVLDALSRWQPVWVVIDGSDDGSDVALDKLGVPESELRILRLPRNQGKGAAVLAGFNAAAKAGFRRALVMDADGQHPCDRIELFMKVAEACPEAMVLGVPEFGPEAPRSRRQGRRFGNWWTNLETLWGGIGDSLFGFRVYQIQETLKIFQGRRSGRRYDFDTIAVVRLFWSGVRPINVPVPVKYFSAAEGGVSHFRYLRDNVLLVFRHVGLVIEMLVRWPMIMRQRQRAHERGTNLARNGLAMFLTPTTSSDTVELFEVKK